MAGPFARQRRAEGATTPEPDAPTEVADGADQAPAPADATVEAAEAGTGNAADTAQAQPAADTVPGTPTPGFVQRGRLRRRLRYVRRVREVALRDLGGLVFDLHRFGRERSDLVEQKLAALATLDGEQRALEAALREDHPNTVLREPGLASCPRCGALHASDAAYCSACGLPVGRGADLPTGPSLTGPVGTLPAGDGAQTVQRPPAAGHNGVSTNGRPDGEHTDPPAAPDAGAADEPRTPAS